jgi:hypothetical protein
MSNGGCDGFNRFDFADDVEVHVAIVANATPAVN